MVKIFSPMSGGNPLGETIANLGRQLFGDRTANELASEKLYAAQRENAEMDNLMKRAAAGGVQTLGSDPIAQAVLIGSGFDPKKFADIGLMGAATGYGAADPRTQNWQVGSGQSYDNTAGAFGARLAETARANDLASADRRYGVDQSQGTERWKHSTIGADQAADNAEAIRNNDLQSADRRYNVDQNVGETRRQFDQKPMPVITQNGAPGYVPQNELTTTAVQPILSEADQKGTLLGQNWENLPDLNTNQQEVLGARIDGSKSSTPRNYIVGDRSFITYDGRTDAQTGQPLPPGGYIGNVEGGAGDVGLTNSTQSGVQQGILANNKLSNLLAVTREVAEKDPTNFGIPGFVKGVAQDVTQIAQGLAQGLGYQGAEQMLTEAAQSAMRSGVDPNLISGVFDPNLSSLHTLADLMVYASAEALAGQSGRSVSDKDVQFFKGIVGDPQGWLMSQEKFLAKLTQIERILQMNQTELGRAQTDGAVPRTQNAASQGRTQTGVTWSVGP